jgi:thiol-disulfide isomerase/thioredoxin
MKVDKGTVRAPEIGRVWFNSSPLSLRQLRGRVVLIDFWDYTCLNCIRTLPYVQAWHERYRDKGLTVIGVHTPEFTFAQYESNVERGIREFGLTYPIVVDSDYELWKVFANRCWPTKYLLDSEGYLRWAHFGEGAYRECEETIQELLRESNVSVTLPPLMEPVRAEDGPGAVCYVASPELYLGHKRGRIGNPGGFKEDQIADYDFKPDDYEEGYFYARGRWASTVEYFESVGEDEHRIVLKYSASGVNLVMAAPRESACEVLILQDGKPLTSRQATVDTRFRISNQSDQSLVEVRAARMYGLVENHAFGEHILELICPPGLAVFAFTFGSCVDPARARPSAETQVVP